MSLLNSQELDKIGGLASALGLTKWQIQDASWNGYKFATADSNLFSKLSSGLGAVSTAISAASSIYDSTKLALGLGNEKDIPGGANLQAMSTIDKFNRKLAINSLPNGKDNIRSLGYNGQEINMIGICWGTNYLGGLKNNLENMFYSDQVVNPTSKDYHVLVHPFWGRIEGAVLANMEIIHQATTWRACVYKLKFITETPIGYLDKQPRSPLQIISDSITAIIGIASAINKLWSVYENIFDRNSALKSTKNNSAVQAQVQTIQKSTLASTNNAMNAVKLMTANLAPSGYNNVALNKYPTNKSTLSKISYFQNHSTPQDINNLINYITDDINNTINTIYSSRTNYYYDTINLLQGLIAQTSNYSLNLLQTYYGQTQQYKIPYNMNLFIACKLNQINYELNYQKIIELNQGKFFWLNKLSKDDIIVLPLGNI